MPRSIVGQAVAVLVLMAACGGDDVTQAGATDCGDAPTVPDWRAAAAPPPPGERAMLVAEGRSQVDSTADDLTTARDLTESVDGPVSFVLYGDPEAEDPFAERQLGVWYSNDVGVLHATEGEVDDQRDTTTVRGHEAFISRNTREPEVEMAWAECADLGISLRSHSYSVEELASIADHLQVSEDGVHLESGAVDGLDEVLAVDGAGQAVRGEVLPGTSSREVAYFGYPDVGGGNYTVETVTLGGEGLAADTLRLRWMFDNPGTRSARVRGQDALVYEWPTSPELTSDEGFTVLWFESPSVAVSVGGGGLVGEGFRDDGSLDIQGIAESTVLDFVEDLHAATPEESAVLLQPEEPPPAGPDDTSVEPSAGVEAGVGVDPSATAEAGEAVDGP